MKLHELAPAPGSTKAPKRLGRGIGSGVGKTSGKGHKGQKARSGGGVRPGFEGGQMPLSRRLPKHGFTNIWAKKYAVVNLCDLSKYNNGETVNAQTLIEKGIIKKAFDGIKVLGNGEVKVKLTVVASKVSKSAAQKIEAAGGKIEVNE